MEKFKVLMVVLLGTAALLMTGCASTPKAPEAKSTAVFQQPIEKVQKAAVDAMVVTGFDVTKQEATYVEGFRPRKVGLFVGSGGETVGIWLSSIAPDKTEVKVNTAKSFVGYVGQKEWDQEILAEMTKSLVK
jgi:hypothetical protein